MHVLILSHNYPHMHDPTFGFFCKQQAAALVASGHKVGVICPLAYSIPGIILRKKAFPFGMRDYVEDQVITNIFFFPSPPKFKRLKYLLFKKIGIWLLERYIKKHGMPDIMHLHVFYPVKVASYAKRKYNIPVVWTEHFSDIDRGLLADFEWDLLRLASTIASVRIAVSENFRKNLESKLGQKFYYVPNVYNSKLFRYDRKNEKSLTEFRFIHVAGLNSNKNQMRLLKAFQSVYIQTQTVKLIIIGDGDDYSVLSDYIKANGLENQVVLKGFMDAVGIYEELKRAHVCVLSSDYETFGVSIIEAMACGLPVVATRSGGPESIITDPRLGVLVDKSADSLAAGMWAIYQNFSVYNSETISVHAFENYSYEVIGARLTQLYQLCK